MPRRLPLTADAEQFRRNVGQRMQDARLAAGLTQAEVARELEASDAWISNVENGVINIDTSVLVALSKLYGWPVEWFLMDERMPSGLRTPHTIADWEMLFPESKAKAAALYQVAKAFDQAVEKR